jgi:hypothetical protein
LVISTKEKAEERKNNLDKGKDLKKIEVSKKIEAKNLVNRFSSFKAIHYESNNGIIAKNDEK